MSEFSGLRETRKDPAYFLSLTDGRINVAYNYNWVARLCSSGPSFRKATRISHGKNSHWDNIVKDKNEMVISKDVCVGGGGSADRQKERKKELMD